MKDRAISSERKTSGRRLGRQTSANRLKLIEAAIRVLKNEGFGSLSSRRVAEVAGLKQQLVYYYFQSMDELILAVAKKLGDDGLKQIIQAATAERPYEALVSILGDSESAVISMELLALALHHEPIREQALQMTEQHRLLMVEVLEKHYEAMGIESANPAMATVMIISALAGMLGREKAMGFTVGHAEIEKGMQDWITHFYEVRVRENDSVSD